MDSLHYIRQSITPPMLPWLVVAWSLSAILIYQPRGRKP